MKEAKRNGGPVKSLRLSNFELAQAIEVHFANCKALWTGQDLYKPTISQYETLLKEQAKRAVQTHT